MSASEDQIGGTTYAQGDTTADKPQPLTAQKIAQYTVNKRTAATAMMTRYRASKGIVVKEAPVKEKVVAEKTRG